MKRIIKSHNAIRQARHHRVRAKVVGGPTIPRLSVFRSRHRVVLQLVDDVNGKTLCAVDSGAVKADAVEGKTAKVAASFLAGKKLAEAAKTKGVASVVFDRGGYKYHGRVAAVAEGARAGGLQL